MKNLVWLSVGESSSRITHTVLNSSLHRHRTALPWSFAWELEQLKGALLSTQYNVKCKMGGRTTGRRRNPPSCWDRLWAPLFGPRQRTGCWGTTSSPGHSMVLVCQERHPPPARCSEWTRGWRASKPAETKQSDHSWHHSCHNRCLVNIQIYIILISYFINLLLVNIILYIYILCI